MRQRIRQKLCGAFWADRVICLFQDGEYLGACHDDEFISPPPPVGG